MGALVLPLRATPSLHRPLLGTLAFLLSIESSGTASKHREVAREVPGRELLEFEAVATFQHIEQTSSHAIIALNELLGGLDAPMKDREDKTPNRENIR